MIPFSWSWIENNDNVIFSEAKNYNHPREKHNSEGRRWCEVPLLSAGGSPRAQVDMEEERCQDAIRLSTQISILVWWTFIAINISGELEMAGGDIVMEAVSRHHAGTYQCVTRDDYGLEPVTKEVDLFVECKLYQHRNICPKHLLFTKL